MQSSAATKNRPNVILTHTGIDRGYEPNIAINPLM